MVSCLVSVSYYTTTILYFSILFLLKDDDDDVAFDVEHFPGSEK